MSSSSIASDMDKVFECVMRVIVGKGITAPCFLPTHVDSAALTNRYLSHQLPERISQDTSQKKYRRWLSDNDLRNTHNFMPERSAPIDVPSAKTSLGCPRRPCGSTVMAPATGPTPEIELKIPFPRFLNVNSHHAHPHSNMDHRYLPGGPPTPSFMVPVTHKSQKELREDKDAGDWELQKTKAIRQWKIERTNSFPPPPLAPLQDYPYGPEDFELADDFDRIIFLPLEEELLTWYWSDDVTSRIASARSALPIHQDIEPSFGHPQLIRVKAKGDLAAWKMSGQKQVQWGRDSEEPKCPEDHISQELTPKSSEAGAQPSVPMKRRQSHHESEAVEPSYFAVGTPQTLYRAEVPTKEAHQSSEMDFYSSEESYEGSEWTNEDSDYYDDPTPDFFMATEKPSWSREKGKARCGEV